MDSFPSVGVAAVAALLAACDRAAVPESTDAEQTEPAYSWDARVEEWKLHLTLDADGKITSLLGLLDSDTANIMVGCVPGHSDAAMLSISSDGGTDKWDGPEVGEYVDYIVAGVKATDRWQGRSRTTQLRDRNEARDGMGGTIAVTDLASFLCGWDPASAD